MNKLKIFLLEDEKDIRKLFTKRLRSLGFEVNSYEKGDGAIENMIHSLPDIVFLDVKLPGFSGMEIFHEMKKTEYLNQIPVVFLSALHNEEDFCINKLKAQAFLKKPCLTKDLIEALNTCIKYKNEIRSKHPEYASAPLREIFPLTPDLKVVSWSN